MATVRVDGADLAYEELGVGRAVVLSHAGIADRRMWEGPFAALAADHRVIRYDWRGYGESGPARGDYAHHEDLLGLMTALDVDDAVLVGCSMGGAYALEAALADPARVSGLVLVCSGLTGHHWPSEWQERVREQVLAAVPAERLAGYAAGTTPLRARDVEAMAGVQARIMVAGPRRGADDVDPLVWQQALTMLRKVFEREWSEHPPPDRVPDPPAAHRLSEIAVPTLVVNGLEDVPAIQQVSDLLTAGIPGARRVDLPGTAHLPPLERPRDVTALLRGFLTATRGRSWP